MYRRKKLNRKEENSFFRDGGRIDNMTLWKNGGGMHLLRTEDNKDRRRFLFY